MKKLFFAIVLVASATSAMAVEKANKCSIKCGAGQTATCALHPDGCACNCS